MNPAHASPWDALLRPHRPIRVRAAAEPEPDLPQQAREGTKLARLLAELAQVESATTLSLCVRAELEARQVWGLLKAPRDTGQVSHSKGRWTLNRAWRGREIERAVAVLREAGWTVIEPEGKIR